MSTLSALIDHTVPRHRKFQRAGSSASWLWLCGVIHSRELLTDGLIPRESVHHLGFQEPDLLQAAIQRLVAVGLWTEIEEGWRIHDFLDHNHSAAEVAAIRAANRANASKGGQARAQRYQDLRSRQVADRQSDPAKRPAIAARQSEVVAPRYADALAPRRASSPSPSPSPSLNKKEPAGGKTRGVENTCAREDPVTSPRRPDAAWEGARVWVPRRIHTDFMQFLNRPDAEKELLTWYGVVATDWAEGAHRNTPTGADMFAFWRARFNERWPPAPPAVGVRGSKTTGNAAAIRAFVGGPHDS